MIHIKAGRGKGGVRQSLVPWEGVVRTKTPLQSHWEILALQNSFLRPQCVL